MSSDGSYLPHAAYLFDIDTGSVLPLPKPVTDGVVLFANVSPNQQLLAYWGQELTIVNSAGDILWSHALSELPSASLVGWINNQDVLLSVASQPNALGLHGLDTLIALDPETLEQRVLTNSLPAIFPDNTAEYAPNWGSLNSSKVVYNASSSRAIYPSKTSDWIDELVLWDVPNGKALAVITGTLSNGVPPQWSPSGDGFIISAPYNLLVAPPTHNPEKLPQELFLVTKDGVIEQLTHLRNIYREIAFGTYSWSPDGRSVAVWMMLSPKTYPDLYKTHSPTDRGRLAVLDLETKRLTDYCIPGGYNASKPFWSPDSRQIVVEDYYQSGQPRNGNVYVVDLGRQAAFLIAQNVRPLGWMKSKP